MPEASASPRPVPSTRPARPTRFLVVCAVVLLVRLAALRLPGTEDTWTWKIWMFAASSAVTTVYGVGGDPPEKPGEPVLMPGKAQ